MQAAVNARYGSIAIEEVDAPQPSEGEVLVRVRASSVNAVDWYGFAGRPYAGRIVMGVRSPKSARAGSDFVGVVEAGGGGIARFAPGDEVYGVESGSYAEYVVASDAVAHKPKRLSFEEAAALPVAGLSALQGLRDHGRLQPGQRVLVNGASGGVGTFAVQVGKALGTHVTAVCSTRNLDLMHSLGADAVVDYTTEDPLAAGERFDVVLDLVGNRSLRELRG